MLVLKSFSMAYTWFGKQSSESSFVSPATDYSPLCREIIDYDEDRHSVQCKGAAILQM